MPNFTSIESYLSPVEKGKQSYQASDVDDANNTQYFGFLNPIGNWIIIKYDTAAAPKTLRYVVGRKEYATSWTGRAGLSYGLYNEVINGL